MSAHLSPHLNFRGEARAALEFYQSVFGGELTVVTYKDTGSSQAEAEANQVMWGQVATGSGLRIMAFDALPSRLPFERGVNSFYMAARFATAEETTAGWGKLRQDAHIRHELGPAPWAPTLYGMLEDRFGIVWIVSEDHSA